MRSGHGELTGGGLRQKGEISLSDTFTLAQNPDALTTKFNLGGFSPSQLCDAFGCNPDFF